MPDSDKLTKAAAEIFKAPDHASVLISVAWLDYAIKSIIKMRFRSDLSASENSLIFENNGPISNLWSRVHLAYSLGIIGPITRNNILKLNDIRNVFAHATDFINFKTLEIDLACKDLIVQDNMVKFIFPSSRKHEISSARDQFLYCTFCTFAALSLGVVKEGENLVRNLPEKPEKIKALKEFTIFFDKLGVTQLLP